MYIIPIRRPYTSENVRIDVRTATGDDLRQIADKCDVPHWRHETDDEIRPRVLKALEAERRRP